MSPSFDSSARPAELSLNATWIHVPEVFLGSFYTPALAFDGRPNHVAMARCRLNLTRLVEEQRPHLVQSTKHNSRYKGRQVRFGTSSLMFHLGNGLMVEVHIKSYDDHVHKLTAWAREPGAAEEVVRSWIRRYHRRFHRKHADRINFFLIESSNGGINTHCVQGFKPFILRDEDLALHYGDGFPSWETHFVSQLRSDTTGAVILTGAPGTGKTSFIRHLIYKLRDSHHFYYVPVAEYPMIGSPAMVRFWLNQHGAHPNMKLAVILEDAECLLAVRGPDNAANVSNILNMADGLLGEFLKLQLICTINCKVDQLDPAVLRTGRLINRREFRRLNQEEALQLATAKGISLPNQQDYSLAEVYAGTRPQFDTMEQGRPELGFSA